MSRAASSGDHHSVSPQPRRLIGVGGSKVFCFELPSAGRVTLGRSSEADILVLHPTVSRVHAALSIGAEVSVHDLGSMNGTRVSGQRLVAGETKLLGAIGLQGATGAFEIGSVSFLVQRRVASVSQDLEEGQRGIDPDWDVERLAVAYADLASDMFGLPRARLSDQALQAIVTYPWGVGASEIKGVLYRAVLVAAGTEVLPEHLKLADRKRPAAANNNETPATLEDLGADLAIVERERLRDALVRAGGNPSTAARTLGMPQGVFRRRAFACGIVIEEPGE